MELDCNDLIDDRILVIMQEVPQWPETKRANRYCVDCGSRLVYYPRLSNPKAPNEYRTLVYACPDCSNDFDKPKMFSIKRNIVENPLETVEIEIKQIQKQLQNNPKK